jgi:flagellar motor switch protein FliG
LAENPLNGLEKAAVLLKSLSPTIVDKVLAHMEPRQAKLLTTELAKVSERKDLKEIVSSVLDEAVKVLVEDQQNRTGKPMTANNAAPALKLASQVDVRVDGAPEVGTEASNDADPLASIAKLSPELLTMALESENARTISLLMNRMEVETAGQIYRRLSPAKRREVSLRFTEAAVVSEDLLRHIAGAVLKKCQTLRCVTPPGNEQGEREKRMAGLLRGLERTERLEMLAALEGSNPDLAGRIKALLYLFEDILRLEKSSIQKLLSEIDMKSLASALYGAPPEIEERILTNLSRRAQESLKEEADLLGKVAAAKVKQARQTLEEAMQTLDQRGELLLME